jgi:hypothetical protein
MRARSRSSLLAFGSRRTSFNSRCAWATSSTEDRCAREFSSTDAVRSSNCCAASRRAEIRSSWAWRWVRCSRVRVSSASCCRCNAALMPSAASRAARVSLRRASATRWAARMPASAAEACALAKEACADSICCAELTCDPADLPACTATASCRCWSSLTVSDTPEKPSASTPSPDAAEAARGPMAPMPATAAAPIAPRAGATACAAADNVRRLAAARWVAPESSTSTWARTDCPSMRFNCDWTARNCASAAAVSACTRGCASVVSTSRRPLRSLSSSTRAATVSTPILARPRAAICSRIFATCRAASCADFPAPSRLVLVLRPAVSAAPPRALVSAAALPRPEV